MIHWIKKIFETKESASAQVVLLNAVPGDPVSPKKDYAVFADGGYANCGTVYACINARAKAIGGLQWIVQKRRGGKWKELDEHPLQKLMRKPNPSQGGAKFFENYIGYLLIAGNAYIERVGPGSGDQRANYPPRELYLLRPDRVRVVPGDAMQLVSRYEYRAGGQKSDIIAPLVMHSKLFAPTDDWYGLSPLQVLAKSVDTDNIAVAWNFSLIKNGGRPSGALAINGNLNDVQYLRLRQMVTDQAGADNSGKPMILEGGMQWLEMGLNPKDMDWLESRKIGKQDMAMVYGVPAEMIGINAATYENRREARRAFYTETVIPAADSLRDDLSSWLLPLYGDNLRLDYDRDSIEALQEDREKLWTRVQNSTCLTMNEKRVALGYDERPDGDVLLVPYSLTPLSQTGDQVTVPTVKGMLGGDEAKGLTLDQELAGGSTEWKARAREFIPVERHYRVDLQQFFKQQRSTILSRIESGMRKASQFTATAHKDAVGEILFVLDDETGKLKRISRAHFKEAVRKGGKAVWTEVGADGDFDPETDATQKRVEYQLRELSGVNETTRDALEKQIIAGLSNGESPIEIAQRIKDYYDSVSTGRATTIARTEVAKAYNGARWDAMKQLNIRGAEWFSANDEKVRDGHDIDGEFAVLGEKFSNGLLYPNDPSGAAENVINCRCVVVPAKQESE